MGSGISKKKRKSLTTPGDLDSPDGSSSDASSPHKMPLFRKQSNDAKKRTQHQQYLTKKQSKDAKKRLQHQQYMAREAPEPTIDLSSCEIDEVPSGTFSLCKVFQKEALLLHTNWLTSLTGGGSLQDLACLRVLDLHDNEFTSLPDDIHLLQSLQVLNLENNKIKHLPESISSLQALQSLNVKGNNIKHFPEAICKMRSLRTLDISKNRVTQLLKELCHVRTLETLIVDTSEMTYPDAEIASEGTESIMRVLCTDCGVEYEPPSKFLLEILDPPKVHSMKTSGSHDALAAELTALTATVMQYEQIKDKRRQEQLSLEKVLEDEQRMQAELLANSMAHRTNLLAYMEKDQERFDKELTTLQQQKEAERQQLVVALSEAERGSEELVKQLLLVNESARKTEELLEQMERERIENEQWFSVRQEEMENLRKKDVIANMELILADCSAFTQLFDRHMANRDDVVRRAQESSNAADGKLESLMISKHEEQNLFIQQLMKEESLQKEAFSALQLQKDAKHQRLTGQIELIEQELTQLTMLEVGQRELRVDLQQDVLEQRRRALTALLTQLLSEKESRECELHLRLGEMEQQRLDDQTDYWLVQYQRLMDMKPQALIDQETNLEKAVIHIIQDAGLEDYIPTFARHRITIETLCHMKEDDFKQMGIHEFGLRAALMRRISEYQEQQETEEAKGLKLKKEKGAGKGMVPTAPPLYPDIQELPTKPSAPPAAEGSIEEAVGPSESPRPETRQVTARGLNSECVICMNDMSTILFLNCGHVCCCVNCSDELDLCPMCRAEIVTKIKLTLSSMDMAEALSSEEQFV